MSQFRSQLFVVAFAVFVPCGSLGGDAEGDNATGPVIGIDLGTTYSCVGILRKGGVEIIPNDQGNRITPSYVGFSKQGGRLIGESAKNEVALMPSQVLFDVKRLIGRRFSDPTVQQDMKTLPYKILEDDGKLKIALSVLGEITYVTPEEVSAMVLTKMKETAANFLGEEVKRAVITVPAYFDNGQREATKDAGMIAGLDVVRIINEPTAAAMAYGLDKKDEANIIVYDLGGGTFDVSLLTVAQGVVEVIATNGDTHLGGEDFDLRLAEHLEGVFSEKHGKNASVDKKAMAKLRRAAEDAKLTLSSKKEVTIEVDSLFEGIDFETKLTRAKFEELNIDLFRKTLGPVKKVLEDGKMTKDEINEVVLVGGSTRIPRVQELLKGFFNGKKLNQALNADEAVAHGAAIQAGILAGVAAEATVLLDITPISLGIETNGGLFDTIVSRNTAIPVTKSRSFVTPFPDQTETAINVYEGERRMIKDNNLLGKFTLGGFPKGPAGIKHDVTLDIDANGIMTVRAEITDSKLSKEMTISKDKRRLNAEEIAEAIKNADLYAKEDEKAVQLAKKKADFDIFLKETQSKMDNGVSGKLSEDERDTVDGALTELRALQNDDGDKDVPTRITDPDAKMPEGWNAEAERKIMDPDAKQPHDWDAEEDGDWEAPIIDNPACAVGCGAWTAPTIANPEHMDTKFAAIKSKVNGVLAKYPADVDEESSEEVDDLDPEFDALEEDEGSEL